MSRANLLRPAVRPAMPAKALVSGPSGAGKTWTSLSMLRAIVGPDGLIAVVDTEKESALSYADRFDFHHIPWREPYDPAELAETLIDLDMNPDVEGVIVDSLTHFWRGTGGTLEIADGKFTGWKGARPIQNRFLDVICGLQTTHAVYCARSKMEYAVSEDGGSYGVTRLGMAPEQDASLMYELNVAFDLDMEHRLTVTKSRSTAVPVGRMYPAGTQDKAAEDYKAWLDGGVPPATRAQVDEVVSWFAQVEPDKRAGVKQAFVRDVGLPDTLNADQVDDAHAWLTEHIGPLEAVSRSEGASDAGPPAVPDETPEANTGPENAADGESDDEEADRVAALRRVEVIGRVSKMERDDVVDALKLAGQAVKSKERVGALRDRLAAHWIDSPDEDPAQAPFDMHDEDAEADAAAAESDARASQEAEEAAAHQAAIDEEFSG